MSGPARAVKLLQRIGGAAKLIRDYCDSYMASCAG